MPPDSAHAVTLACHPESPSEAVQGVAARVRRAPGGALAVTYLVQGDLDRVFVPARGPRRIADGLWQHTCCEIFIARKGLPAYHEFNLSPSGEWAGYAFDSYRERRAGASGADGRAPQLTVRSAADRLELDAVIRLDDIPTLTPGVELSLALSAVIEEKGGTLSYWALWHPPGRPDFHHPRAFALGISAADLRHANS